MTATSSYVWSINRPSPIRVTGRTARKSGTTNNNFITYNLNLSDLSAIENAGVVELRFTMPTIVTNTSVRLDNLQISAAEIIPEPTVLSLAGLAFGWISLRRRRR